MDQMQIRIGVWIAFLLTLCFVPAQGDTLNSNFPVPETLKENVEFWIKIYTSYSSDEVVIHDSEHFIIYDVVDLGKHIDHNVIKDVDWKKVKAVKKKYATALLSLSSSITVDTCKLSPTQLKVFKLWANIDIKGKFSQAYRNIRAQRGLSDHFRKGLERSGRYIQYIENTLQEYGVPKELAALPMVESSYHYRAYSKMGAAGIWQFTRSTGRLFLTIDYSIDERFDPIKSTEAAAKLLKLNYDELGTWPLAITAYNHGLAGMRRAMREIKTNDFGTIVDRYQSRSFGFASKNFYAEFIAAKNVWHNYRRYFGEINFQKPSQMITFELPDFIKLSTLMTHFDVELTTVEECNPALRKPVLQSKRYLPKGYQFRFLQSDGIDAQALYAQIPDSQKYTAQIRDRYYKVHQGDTLSKIARRYGTSVKSLMAMNNISDPHRLHVGQTIEVPPAQTFVAKSKKTAELAMAETTKADSTDVPGGGIKSEIGKSSAKQISDVVSTPKVADTKLVEESITAQDVALSTDTLTVSMIIDSAYGAFLELPIDLSSFDNSEFRDVKQSDADSFFFQVPFEQPISNWINVQAEETLGHYADWLGLRTQTLRSINGLPYGIDIRVGQRIKLSFDKATREEFHRRRTEYHRGIQEDFFTRFHISGELAHAVKSGENIWHLCSRLYTVPYWLLERYNPNKNLMQLHPGDVIIVPDISVRTVNSEAPSEINMTGNPTESIPLRTNVAN